jgi:O-antigen/teichoic acid export membrane protein
MNLTLPKFSYVLIGKSFSTGFQAIFYLSFAFFLDPTSYGNLTYFIALAATISIISRFGFNQSITISQAKNNLKLSNSINLLSIITCGLASLFLIFLDPLIALLSFGFSLFTMNIQNLIGLGKYQKYMWFDIAKGILLVLLPIILFQFFELNGIIIGMTIAYLVSSFDFLKSISFSNFSFSFIKNRFNFLLHNFGVDIANYAPKFFDKLLIFSILDLSSLGIYQLNLQILFGLEVLPMALHSFLLSEKSRGISHRKIIILSIVASILITVVIIFISPYLISTFFPQYVDGIESLQLLVLSLIPLTINVILYAELQSKESKLVGFSGIVRIVSLLAFILFLSTGFGLLGLSLSVFLSITLTTLFLYYAYRKI